MRKVILSILISSLFLSCEEIKKSIDETFKPNEGVVEKEIQKNASTTNQNQEIKKEIDLLTDTATLKKAEAELRQLPQYKGKEMFVFSMLYFYNDGRINVMLQHPENPKYVDTYEFREGKWSAPLPVQLSVRDDIKSRLVPLNKISFLNAAKVAQIYNEKTQQIEGAKPTTSVYAIVFNNQLRWYPTSIQGSRERYSIQFNEDGSLNSFQQD
ncbi:hypothetical protein K6T82_11880 [Flavobacterium sp. 17A]|uniref:Uncharacterized protein n=1 Tax=Flavobacterium potami TaxID=2872310 RepID=A0A9X1KQG9_9FLAO|nr:hypothetical protein [Flavobacterium potami]MBZ4035470.1 hypothetical protein [Flavobacterium potami]